MQPLLRGAFDGARIILRFFDLGFEFPVDGLSLADFPLNLRQNSLGAAHLLALAGDGI